MLRVAALNLDFTSGHNEDALAYACGGVDVLLVCEAKDVALATALPEGWATMQDTSTSARAGSAVCWRRDRATCGGYGLALCSPRGPAVQARWLAWATLEERGGGTARFYAGHAPLKATGLQEQYEANAAAAVRRSGALPVIFGGDMNQPPANAAKALGLDLIHGADVMVLAGRGVRTSVAVTDRIVKAEGWTDHALIRANVILPTPKEPAVSQVRLTQLADVLRKGGLKVVEIDGWKTRSRPESSGGFAPVGVLWHHTGSHDRDPKTTADDLAYAKWLATEGRSDLPAPLCQLSIDRTGTVYVIAAGRANHAGKAKASGTVAAGDGNSLYVGVECHNNGTEGWPAAQYRAMVQTGVALGRMLGCTPNAQRGHKETSVTGKWDPGKLDMDDFREDIAAAMQPRPVPSSTRTTRTRDRILAALNHDDAKSIPASRRIIRARLALIRSIANRLR